MNESIAGQINDSMDSLNCMGTSESSLDATIQLGTPVASPIVNAIPSSRGKSGKNMLADQLKANAAAELSLQKRRSSSRSIKRKKFDDELVESSLIKTNRGRPQLPMPSHTISSVGPVLPTSTIGLSALDLTMPETPLPPLPEKKKTPKSSSKRVKKSKNFQAIVSRDLGRWKPTDDLALIIAVQQTNDLASVHQGMKFSCKFTLKEIQERWYALLYDSAISKMAVTSMKQLHPEMIVSVQNKALFSKAEEALLKDVSSTSQPTVDMFQEILNKNHNVFYVSRTGKSLYNHWQIMKQYHLLPDQTVQPMPRGDHVLNFSDAEEMINDSELHDPRDDVVENELNIADRRIKQEIRHLENELPKWQVLVDSVTGISPVEFDNQTLAVLRGRLVRYLMRSREISFGRATKDNSVDVDLSLEGPAWKISRRQGMIKLQTSGDFYVFNEGKRALYIDSKPVLAGNKCRLNSNSVVEISGLRFIFLINQELISIIRAEAAKIVS